MSEKPILFNSEMVKAILEGRKSQTRRVMIDRISKQPVNPSVSDEIFKANMEKCLELCPYGQTGDHLWLRESACYGPQPERVEYSTDMDEAAKEAAKFYGAKFKTGRFMPRRASRITLEITGIRVERVRDASLEDMKAEGVENYYYSGYDFDWKSHEPEAANFIRLWDSINAKRGYGWDVNPWVWVVKFRKIEK